MLEIEKIIEAEAIEIKGEVHKVAERGRKGVYILLDARHRPLYVGRGIIRDRVSNHLNDGDVGHNYIYVRIIYMKHESDVNRMEEILIDTLNPIFNIARRWYVDQEKRAKYSAIYNKKIERYEREKGIYIEKDENGNMNDNGINKDYQRGFEEGFQMGWDTGFDEGYEKAREFKNRHKNLF